MVATLTFLGATGTVTGSKFLLESEGRRTMVDCGLYQGESTWRRLNWKPLPVDPESISDVVLTHAHLDHCGHLPALVRGGFAGPTWCTHGTAALASIVLRDSAHLQEEDAENARLGGFSRHDPPRPLYDAADAETAIRSFKPVDYHQHFDLDSGAGLTLSRAGHILGSATALALPSPWTGPSWCCTHSASSRRQATSLRCRCTWTARWPSPHSTSIAAPLCARSSVLTFPRGWWTCPTCTRRTARRSRCC